MSQAKYIINSQSLAEMAYFPTHEHAEPPEKLLVASRLFYTDHHPIDLPASHKFPLGKYRMLREVLAREHLFTFAPALLATPEMISLAHDPNYVDQVMAGSLTPTAIRRMGFPWSEDLVRRSLASVGATLSATADALEHGWGGTLSGGTHHAFRAEGAGFCVFNDIAVAIQWLRKQGRIRRAAVVDLDVHQGDGTAEIFQDDPDVFTLSIHCHSNFPFRKQKSSLDIDLPDKIGDVDYLEQLDQALPYILAFAPDIIFYQAGVDPLASDALGRLSLTYEGLKQRDRTVMEAARGHDIPLVLTAGGGYARPMELSVEAHANTYRVAADVFLRR